MYAPVAMYAPVLVEDTDGGARTVFQPIPLKSPAVKSNEEGLCFTPVLFSSSQEAALDDLDFTSIPANASAPGFGLGFDDALGSPGYLIDFEREGLWDDLIHPWFDSPAPGALEPFPAPAESPVIPASIRAPSPLLFCDEALSPEVRMVLRRPSLLANVRRF